jgi:hypothetical protein
MCIILDIINIRILGIGIKLLKNRQKTQKC